MMTHGISQLLFSAAAGYWVITLASKEKPRVKQLGVLVGLIILVVSLGGIACTLYCRMSCGKGGSSFRGMKCSYMKQQPPMAPADQDQPAQQ